jgi:predicted Zn-ribbon and HTH transcriptional regulator
VSRLEIRMAALARAARGRRAVARDYRCGGCGLTLDERAARSAAFSGCPHCGSTDIGASLAVQR